MRALLTFVVFMGICASGWAATASSLAARGFTVIPEPQKVTLGTSNFIFGPSWRLKLDSGISAKGVAAETLRQDLASRFGVTVGGRKKPGGVLTLRIAPGSVEIGNAQDPNRWILEEQAYRIDLKPEAVTITANAPTGLFYGVETFIQLLKPNRDALWLPEGSIVDWPDLELRSIYWDDNHHLDRMDTLKHALRQAAFYKINGFALKLKGHFQYKSAPALVDPYALTPGQYQELTDYGLRYHIQLIPYVDGPGHMADVLKHPEYKNLREFPDNNYESCSTNPASYKLLDGMYQDLMDANKGVKYFHLATDEPYYIGLADNSQCNEANLAQRLGSVGRVEAHFIDEAGGYLHSHGRTPIIWGYSQMLKPGDVSSLPKYVINGLSSSVAFDRAYKAQGIPQMIETSTQGVEPMFPHYFRLPSSRTLHHGRSFVPRVQSILNSIDQSSARVDSTVIGEINAGWGDSGLHPETFWLGYVASGAAGWHPGSPNAQGVMNAFYPLFYGRNAESMNQLYRMMSLQAQAYGDSWDTVSSTHRKGIWGEAYGIIFKTREPATDQTIPLPPAPTPNLAYRSRWSVENARRIQLASQDLAKNGVLLGLIGENLDRAQFNLYNLDVYHSIAELYRQNFQMILEIGEMDGDLHAASHFGWRHPEQALAMVDSALDTATAIWRQRNLALQNAKQVWYKSWEPRVAEANGRQFLHEIDDVKDHLPARTVDMTYLVYREKILPFGNWVNAIAKARNEFAAQHDLPARDYHMNWQDFTVPTPVCSSTETSICSHSSE